MLRAGARGTFNARERRRLRHGKRYGAPRNSARKRNYIVCNKSVNATIVIDMNGCMISATDYENLRLENKDLKAQLQRANRIIGWMMPYVGKMCPPENGLFELNEHCFENKVPSPGDDAKSAPLDQPLTRG